MSLEQTTPTAPEHAMVMLRVSVTQDDKPDANGKSAARSSRYASALWFSPRPRTHPPNESEQ